MWMFGKVTQAEYDRIEKQGWQIERMPSAAEIHQFCDPASWKTKDPTDIGIDDFFVLVYLDIDIEADLSERVMVSNISKKLRAMNERLRAEREQAKI